MRCYVSKNWKFKRESDTVDRPYSLARSFWSRINPEWLMPCWEPQPMRPACWCREESCSGPGAPWPARRCLPEQPSLCRWSLFLQHSSPLSCCPAFSFPLNCTQNSVPLRNQKLSWQVFVRPEKCWQGPFSDTQEHKREGFSIHVPLCLDCLPLALPGPLPLLRVCWCLSSICEWLRRLYLNIYQSLLIWESCLPPRPLVAIRDTRLGDECQECEC